MNDSLDFTPDERLLVEHYRHPANSSGLHLIGSAAVVLSTSLLFMALYITGADPAWGAVAYLILVYRVICDAWHARRWNPAIRGVIGKYEARIAALEKRQTPRPTADEAAPA
ncbi:hypothetical protein [Luteolibacter sp. Populi]|uniref:hypothetical protein n=1 Tax=Luteolibacter sp. Populi TaxID=3230487 RepID=UPI0034657AD4